MKANEVRTSLMDVEAQYNDRKKFLDNLADLLGQTDMLVKSIELDREETMRIITKDGGVALIKGCCVRYVELVAKALEALEELRKTRAKEQ